MAKTDTIATLKRLIDEFQWSGALEEELDDARAALAEVESVCTERDKLKAELDMWHGIAPPDSLPTIEDSFLARAAADGLKIAALEVENERLLDRWLCPEGLTVRGFFAGFMCPDCGLGESRD